MPPWLYWSDLSRAIVFPDINEIDVHFPTMVSKAFASILTIAWTLLRLCLGIGAA